MKFFGKSRKIFYVALVVNLIVAGAYAFVFIKIRAANQRIVTLSGVIDSEAKKKDSLHSAKDIVASTVKEREKLDSYFIPKDGIVAFLNFLQSLGGENNLQIKIDNVNIAPAKPVSKIFETVKISFSALGSWSDARRLVALSELLPYGASLEEVNLEKVSAGVPAGFSKKTKTENGLWKLSASLSVFKLK